MSENGFKERLKTLVGDQSSRAFAQKCEISDSVIRAYLRGDSDPTLGKIEKIAHACKVKVGWLAAGEGSGPVCETAKESAEVAASITTRNPDARERIIKQRAVALQGKQLPEKNNAADQEIRHPAISPQNGAQIAYRVLSSNTSYAGALWENLLSFQKAMEREEEMGELTDKVDALTKLVEDLREEMRAVAAGGAESKKRDSASNA